MYNESQCNSYLTVPNYIFQLILPKCNMVLGSYITSVYFQIFLNICHDDTIELWKYKKCWLSQETIAKNLHCTRTTVQRMVKHLINLNLIKKGKHLRHNTYELLNNELDEFNLEKFNRNLENKLLLIAQQMGKNCNDIQNKFNKLELEIAYHQKSIFKFVKNTKLKNTNKIRNDIKKIERDNNGITIFYINDVLNPNNHLQRYRALRDGLSQPCICQYTKYCVNKKLLKLEENKMYKQPEKKQLKPVMCPICNKLCASKGYLKNHLAKSKEENHQKLYDMHKNNPNEDILTLYENNKNDFSAIEPSYKDVVCENCNGNCRLCYKEWKEDFLKCSSERRILFEKQEQKYINFIDKQNKKPKFKKINPNSSSNLLKYFYNQTNTKSPNFAKECKQIKILLDKKYTPEQIKLTMDYLIKRKNIDLRFLNRNIEDAILEDKYKKDINIKDTAAYLVKLFHDKLNIKLNIFNFINEVNKIQMVLDEGYTPLQIKQTMKYMKNKQCTIINYLPNMIDEAIDFYKNNINDEKSKILYNDLKFNSTNILKINNKYKQKAIEIAKNIFIKREYFKQKYTKFEYAYLIKLNLDKDLINDGIKDKQKIKWCFEYDPSECNFNKDDFLDWLKSEFEKNNIIFNL